MNPNDRLALLRRCAIVASFVVAFSPSHVAGQGQAPVPIPVAGRNSNLASGPAELDISVTPPRIRGDFLLKQDNEGSCARSGRNPKNILCGGNDYGLVDVPGVDPDSVTRDAWGGYYQSADGGDTWESTMLPGHVIDPTPSLLKGFRAVADITVRSGAAGVAYMTGIAFKSVTNQSIGFVATFLDLNNREDDRMPFKLLHINAFDSGPEHQFIDKPWSVVLPPTGAMCSISIPQADGTTLTQTIPDTPVVIGYSIFVGNQPDPLLTRTKEMVVKITNCGRTIGKPMMISQSSRINQGISLARTPVAGSKRIVATWRRDKSVQNETEAIVAAVSEDDGATWSKAITVRDPICPFEQASTAFSARVNTFPSVAIDHTGRISIAWSDRGKDANGACAADGPSRVVVSTSSDAQNWSEPVVVDQGTNGGHQITPSLTYGGGSLLLLWKDLRETAAEYFDGYINEFPLLVAAADPNHPVPPPRPVKHHTIEVYSKMANVDGATPEWGPSVRLSQYKVGKGPGETTKVQKQWEIINLRLFARGKKVFDGDYLDAAAPAMLPPDASAGRSQWTVDTGQAGDPVYYGVWTSNRDVTRVAAHTDLTGDQPVPWTPPALTGPSWSDPTQTRPQCVPGTNEFTNTMDQNLYGARVSRGLFAFSPGNNKQVSDFQRAYVVTVRNDSNEAKTYSLVIPFDPPGVFASFSQFNVSDKSRVLTVAPRSTASRSVFIIPNETSPPTSRPLVRVDVTEVGTDTNASVYINSDPSAPEIEAPEIEAPEIEATEVYSPEIEAAQITVFTYAAPEIEAPEIEAPEIEAPEIEAPEIEANSFQSPEIEAPEIEAPEIEAPEIEAPEIEAPEIEAQAITDITWPLTNSGNTTAGYQVRPTVEGSLAGFDFQLVVSRIVLLPTAKDCQPAYATANKVAVNIKNANELVDPNAIIPPEDLENATIWIAPGERVLVTLRVRGAVPFDPVAHPTVLTVTQQAIDTVLLENGVTEPPSFTSAATPNVVFVDEPGDTSNGAVLTPPVTVLAQDNTGAPLPGIAVTLSLGPGAPEGASLSGVTTAITNEVGVATFDALSVNGAGMGFTLVASAPGALPDTSAVFTVLEACAADGTAIVAHSIVEGPAVNSLPVATRLARFDNDSYPDAVVIHGNGTISKLAGDGLGNFQRRFQFPVPGTSGEPTAVAVGDFNEDGLSDVVIAYPTANVLGLVLSGLEGPLPYFTGSTSALPLTGAPRALAVADFNGDGNEDVVVALEADDAVAVLPGNGDGTFGAPVRSTAGNEPSAIAVGQFNAEGGIDVVVTSFAADEVTVLIGDNLGGFTASDTEAVGFRPVSLAVEDFNGDGFADVAVASAGDQIEFIPGDVRVLFGNSTGSLTAGATIAIAGTPQSIAAADFNQDGRPDVAVANHASFLIAFNGGDGTFGAPRALTAGEEPVDVSDGDVNGDERPDLLITNRMSNALTFDTISVMVNTCGAMTADLEVGAFTDTPDPVNAGEPITYSATVTNNGPFEAGAVTFTQTFGGTFVSATPSVGTCAGTGPVTCDLGTLAPFASATIQVVVNAPSTESTFSSAGVRGTLIDSAPSNNSRGTSTAVSSPTDLVVVNVLDSGPGSMRQALLDSNRFAGVQTIRFDIPGPGPHDIALIAALPQVSDPVVIDATTEPDYPGVPNVQLNGSGAGAGGVPGLSITAGSTTVRGLAVVNFSGPGIALLGGGGNLVEACYIGVRPAGTPSGTNGVGVSVSSSPGNRIGGTSAAARNVISGNAGAGVLIVGGLDFGGNVIQGNLIGTNAAGTAAVPNGGAGISLAAPTTVGGNVAGAGNLISGNAGGGIVLGGDDHQSTIQGNFIGTNAAGTAAIPNAGDGISIGDTEFNVIGGPTPAARNVISGNTGFGLALRGDASASTVQGNFIGVNAAGVGAIPNGGGVLISGTFSTMLGGTAPGAGNVISGNLRNGVELTDAVNNDVLGNYIGTDASGALPLGNQMSGVIVTGDSRDNRIGSAAAGGRNVISGNNLNGVLVAGIGANNSVQGNYVGTNAAGVGAVANLRGVIIAGPGTTLGGSAAGAGNLISGNGGQGVGITGPTATANVVLGNRIGTVADGSGALPNGSEGVFVNASASGNTIGGVLAGEGNVISGNGNNGIAIADASGNSVLGNRIGTNAAGSASVANGTGVLIQGDSDFNVIGGAAAGARNIISGNRFYGVAISGLSASANRVEGNYIGTNATGSSALGNLFGVRIDQAAANTIGGAGPGEGNVISGNGDGIGIFNGGNNNLVRGNLIGSDASGLAAVPNGRGVVVDGIENAFVDNLIAFNTGIGAEVIGGIGTTLGNNRFHSNGGLGIDLAPRGVNPNDAGDVDVGPNELQNFPVVELALAVAGTTEVSGTVSSAEVSTVRITLYVSAVCDPAGNGEGAQVLGEFTVLTDGGTGPFSVIAGPTSPGQFITATAMSGNGSTSEFSACVQVQ
ncbi:MAG TPA: FG-GAP-like repeat-containing protein [Vicinamibacterales bacterium]|nr:FG-GAP-like repeat-containing protein [Vicinamibacterales bacterium]